MTLIEVLAALAVLGLAASAHTPWLRAAIRSTGNSESDVSANPVDPDLIDDLVAERDPWGLHVLGVGQALPVVVEGHAETVVVVERRTARDPLGGAWFEASVGDGVGRAFWMPIREGEP